VSPGPAYDRLFEGHGLGTNQVAYYSMIRNLDDNIGQLLDTLAQWRLDEETLVIFLTDNGHSIGSLYNAGMRAAKGSPYRGGTRVPSFWRWPGRITPGNRVQPAAHIDVFPTLVELAGAPLRPALRAQLEGLSLVPCLDDPGANWGERTIVTHVGRWPSGQSEAWKYRGCALRQGRFKLVNHTELYDLMADPGEIRDIADQHTDIVAELQSAYDRWWDSIHPAVLENEEALGPEINPFKRLFWRQFGGGPDDALLERMDPSGKFSASAIR
jgi:arylsulfatase